MGKPLAETTHVLMNRELVLYKSPRSEVWQCRYKVDHRWLRASTREYKFDLACHKAKELLIEAAGLLEEFYDREVRDREFEPDYGND